MKLTGAQASVFIDSFDETKIITGGSVAQTEANKWYRIMEKGEGSDLPLKIGCLFLSPTAGDQISLVPGDSIYPLDPSRFCKTSASFSAEQGTVDVGDDCDPGATILDGIVNITGSLAGFFRYDNATGDFDNVTDEILNRFFDITEDDGRGIYELRQRVDAEIYLLCLLNSGASEGQTENWIYAPIILPSMSMSLGNTDAQNRDLSFSKGEGPSGIYKRLKLAV
jgi:hypothetical protein